MSHVRVLICRVEDDDEQMTERASVDLRQAAALWEPTSQDAWLAVIE